LSGEVEIKQQINLQLTGKNFAQVVGLQLKFAFRIRLIESL